MKLTVKLDYACRALICLARRYGRGEVIRLEEMAKEEDVPVSYLAQILGELRNGGLVSSRRGKQGGYLLARSPDSISLFDVISLIQGASLSPPAPPAGASGPMVAEAWRGLQDSLVEKAKATALSEIITNAESKMYYI